MGKIASGVAERFNKVSAQTTMILVYRSYTAPDNPWRLIGVAIGFRRNPS